MAKEQIKNNGIMIPLDVYEHISILHESNNELRKELNDEYVNGFYDGVEIVLAAIENRNPDLTDVNQGGMLM